MKAKKYFVCSDSHVLMQKGKVAGIDLLTNNAIVKFMEDEGPWDGYIHAGDNYDLNVISDHNKGKLKLVEGQRLLDDYRAGNAVLEQHYAAVGKPEDFYLIEANHEYREVRYREAKPELEGFINLELHIPKFVKYIKYWSSNEILQIGKATFIHGIGSGRGQCAAGLRDYGTNVFMGHTHRRELVSMRHHGPDSTKIGESLPCLCEYRQPYLKGAPSSWQQGFAVFQFWPSGVFNYTVTSVFNHSFFAPSGKFYNGRKMRPETKLVVR